MTNIARQVLMTVALMLFGLFTVPVAAKAGQAVPGRIVALHRVTATDIFVTIQHPDGPEAACPARPNPPYYGRRMKVPTEDKNFMAMILSAHNLRLLVNIYWSDSDCMVHAMDLFR